jgi:sulfate permease, SulP family
MIFRFNTQLLFINASWMRDAVLERMRQAKTKPRIVVVDLGMSHDLDIQGLDKLTRLVEDLRDSGIELRLANVHQKVRDMLERGGFAAKVGEDHIYRTLHEAVRDIPSEAKLAEPVQVPNGEELKEESL